VFGIGNLAVFFVFLFVSEESAILSFPDISIRQSMERPEVQDAGTLILTGFDPNVVLDSIRLLINEHVKGSSQQIPAEYEIQKHLLAGA
jgi:UDP-N-acetylglucosamine 2-epimerase